MAATKKRTKKSKAKKSSNSNLWRQLERNKLLIFVAAFAVLGAVWLVRSRANPALPEFSDDIVAAYTKLTPTVIKRDKDGNTAYEMYPKSTYVQADGTVVCDAGGKNGQVQTGKLNRGELRRLQKDMLSSGVTKLADEVGAENKSAFVSFEGIMVAEGTQAKGTAVYEGARKPKDFDKAQRILDRACAKASRKTRRDYLRAPREPRLKKTRNRKSALESFKNIVFKQAFACCGAGTRDSSYESTHAASINNHRAKHGRAKLALNKCLSDRAAIWSDAMTRAGAISHSPTFAADVAACRPTWRAAGENVGVGNDNTGLINAFIGSPTHNQNMLEKKWREFGVGAVRRADGRIFVTHRFVQF